MVQLVHGVFAVRTPFRIWCPGCRLSRILCTFPNVPCATFIGFASKNIDRYTALGIYVAITELELPIEFLATGAEWQRCSLTSLLIRTQNYFRHRR
jgi:hypothetical protein